MKAPKAWPCKARAIRRRPDCLKPSLQWCKRHTSRHGVCCRGRRYRSDSDFRHHGPSTTIRHAYGTDTGQSWSNGSWPRSANYAAPRNRSRCTTSGHSKTSIPKGGNSNPNGSHGWPPATARPSSSAAHAMRASTAEAPHGNHEEHWRAEMLGKRASPVRREAVRKGPSWYLAGGPPYRTPGAGGGHGKRIGGDADTAPVAYLTSGPAPTHW